MKKRLTFLVSAVMAVMVAHADTYPYLAFRKTDGTTAAVGTAELTMTFTGGKLIVTNGTENLELTVADLESMYFSSGDVTGIREAPLTDANGEVKAFSLQGVSYGKFGSLQTFKSQAPAGVYVIKGNGKTQKITVR